MVIAVIDVDDVVILGDQVYCNLGIRFLWWYFAYRKPIWKVNNCLKWEKLRGVWEESTRGCLSCRRDYRRYICRFIFSVSWTGSWWWRHNGCSEGWTSYNDDGEDGWWDAGRRTMILHYCKLSKLGWSDIEVWYSRCDRDRSYVFCIFYYMYRWFVYYFSWGPAKGRAGFGSMQCQFVVAIIVCAVPKDCCLWYLSCINAKYKWNKDHNVLVRNARKELRQW